MYTCMYTCMYACMYTCMYACMYTCMYTCMYVYHIIPGTSVRLLAEHFGSLQKTCYQELCTKCTRCSDGEKHNSFIFTRSFQEATPLPISQICYSGNVTTNILNSAI